MKLLTERAVLVCKHQTGLVAIAPSQTLVRIDGLRALVERDPESKAIAGCPMLPPSKPCTTTLPVQRGYSPLVRIEGRRVCLDTVEGLTDGTPPGTVEYVVRRPGQDLVREVA